MIAVGVLLTSAILLQLPSPTPSKSAQEQQGQRATAMGEQQNVDKGTSLASDGTKGGVAKEGGSSYRGERSPHTDWWVIANTGLLTIFTGALAWLAHRQNQAMQTQAEYMRDALVETKKSADAAHASAEALINGERAWVKEQVFVGSSYIQGPGKANQFCFDLVNEGKTVARLMSYRARFHLLPMNARLPQTPDYGIESDVVRSQPVSSVYGRVLSPQAQNGMITESCWSPQITIGIFEDIQQRRATLFFYALIKYFDFVDRERELQFCYYYIPQNGEVPAHWVLSGHPEYNKST